MSILLTDEEIGEAGNFMYENGILYADCIDCGLEPDTLRTIAKAQLKKVMEYLDYHMWGFDNDGLKMKVTPDVATKIRQALLKETE